MEEVRDESRWRDMRMSGCTCWTEGTNNQFAAFEGNRRLTPGHFKGKHFSFTSLDSTACTSNSETKNALLELFVIIQDLGLGELTSRGQCRLAVVLF